MTAVAMERFGKDHWSTFGYAECRIVDNAGRPDRRHMRCDLDRHPQFGHAGSRGPKHPTILRGGERLPDHDDWDCIADLEAAGLIETEGTGIHPLWRLTKRGEVVAAQLRRYKASGGNFATFVPEVTP